MTGSFGSVLTTLQTGRHGDNKSIKKYELAVAYQKDFWDKHKDCFIFYLQTFMVNIDKCFIVRPKYIIRKLKNKIVIDVREELIELLDARQHQPICLTPHDENHQLLRECPKSWNKIKDGEFFIINGQHRIIATK